VENFIEYGPDMVQEPLGGVSIAVYASNCYDLIATGISADNGIVSFNLSPSNLYCITATPPTPAPAFPWLSEPSALQPYRVAAGQTIVQILSYQTGMKAPAAAMEDGQLTVSIEVEGAPIPGTTVTFWRAGSSPCPIQSKEFCATDPVLTATAVTGEDGSLSISLPAGYYDIDTRLPADWVSPWPHHTTPGSAVWLLANQSIVLPLQVQRLLIP
jgi:hypothetical protein